jgi:hypothetical protein
VRHTRDRFRAAPTSDNVFWMRNLVVMVCVLSLAACGVVRDPNAGVDAPCGDGDGDGVCDTEDVCLTGDDSVDADNDTIANACDKCPGFDDKADADSDTVPNGCDNCAGFDDRTDLNGNSIPDGCDVQVRMIDLKSVPNTNMPPAPNWWRGWHSLSGTVYSHDPGNDNMVTGISGSTVFNSYVVFPLAGFTAFSIISVTLEIEVESYGSADATETFSVWDVGAIPNMVEGTTNQAIFEDLMTGAMYGMHTVAMTPSPAGVTQSVMLSTQAAIDLQAKLGQDFAIGLHVDSATLAAPSYLRFAASSEPRVARLVIRYLPVAM